MPRNGFCREEASNKVNWRGVADQAFLDAGKKTPGEKTPGEKTKALNT